MSPAVAADNDALILALAAEYRGIWAAAAHFDRETLRLQEIDGSLCRGFGHQRDALLKRSHVILGGICALAATGLAAAAVQSEAASILAEAATSEDAVDEHEAETLLLALWSVQRVLHAHAGVADMLLTSHISDPFETTAAAVISRRKRVDEAHAAECAAVGEEV